MKKRIIINANGMTIFSFEKEDNTLKKTVEEAVRKGVSLEESDLWEKNLSGVDLHGADLWHAHLRHTNLSDADLSCSCLIGVNLSGADLEGANLRGAKLRGALLLDADLKGANIEDVDIYDAKLSGAKNIPHIPLSCPSEGEFIGWKKIFRYKEDYKGDFLVKLLIPEDAKRCSATTEKCRCSKAKVIEITNIKTGEHVDVITNTYRAGCVYRVGEMVYPDSFDDNRWNECSHGIHFFMDKGDAIKWKQF